MNINIFILFFISFNILKKVIYVQKCLYLLWKMLKLQHPPNYCTTPRHIGVEFIVWAPPQCALGLCKSWDGVVYESRPIFFCACNIILKKRIEILRAWDSSTKKNKPRKGRMRGKSPCSIMLQNKATAFCQRH
jgi:hypothetical protein